MKALAMAGKAEPNVERDGRPVAASRRGRGGTEWRAMSVGEDLVQQRRRRRRAGDPRLSDVDRDILRRITSGDLAPAFQAALDADLVADSVLGGRDHGD